MPDREYSGREDEIFQLANVVGSERSALTRSLPGQQQGSVRW
jgi:hypothetical protein